jgi:hypothetical protein
VEDTLEMAERKRYSRKARFYLVQVVQERSKTQLRATFGQDLAA